MTSVHRCTHPLRYLVLLSAVLVSASIADPNVYQINLVPESRLWLEGDSTMHRYTIDATVVTIDSECTIPDLASVTKPTVMLSQPALAPAFSRFIVTVPIKDMESHIVGLSRMMRSTLKHKKHPNITFVMQHFAATNNAAEPSQYDITATGLLTVAGVTNPAVIEMQAQVIDSHIRVTGEETLRMTDFGVEPPTAFFGALKTYDQLVVKWDMQVVFSPREPPQSRDVADK